MDVMNVAVAAVLVWTTLLLIPMVPGKLVDTRDFSALPRWQYNSFNVLLTTFGLAGLVVAVWLVVAPSDALLWASVVIGLFFVAVFLADLMEIFPVVPDPLPSQLLVLEVLALASAGVIIVLASAALLA